MQYRTFRLKFLYQIQNFEKWRITKAPKQIYRSIGDSLRTQTKMASVSLEFSTIEQEAQNLIATGDVKKAQNLYTTFIDRQKGTRNDKKVDALARNNRGHLRYLSVDFYGAVEDYTAAIALDPCLAVSYYNRGQIHYRMGRFQLAVKDLEKALELDPNFTDARDNLKQAKSDLNLVAPQKSKCEFTT